jgi:exonuclease VII large subunit
MTETFLGNLPTLVIIILFLGCGLWACNQLILLEMASGNKEDVLMKAYADFKKETIIKAYEEQRDRADKMKMERDEVYEEYANLQERHAKLEEACNYAEQTLSIHEKVIPKLELVARLARRVAGPLTVSSEQLDELREALNSLAKDWSLDSFCEICGAALREGHCTDPHCGIPTTE